MTKEEFVLQVKQKTSEVIKDTEYIKSLDSYLENKYDTAKELESLLGYGEPSIDGAVFGLIMIYPDTP